MGRTEEVVPSIDMPLAHEAAVEEELEMERSEGGRGVAERGEAEREDAGGLERGEGGRHAGERGEAEREDLGGTDRGEGERGEAERGGVRAVERDDVLERDDGVGFEL
jgi:hypothetical protein